MEQLLKNLEKLKEEKKRLKEQLSSLAKTVSPNEEKLLRTLEARANKAEKRCAELAERLSALETTSKMGPTNGAHDAEKEEKSGQVQEHNTQHNLQSNKPSQTAAAASEQQTANEKRMRALSNELGLQSEFKRCPPEYYDQSLEWRRDCLGAPSILHLCKTIVMHNTKKTDDDYSNPNDSKYYMIIVQYAAKFNNEKLIKHVRETANRGKKHFNFRLCLPEVNTELTGFSHNGVTPLGSKTKLPIIISHRLLQLPFIWLGGGETDLKWKIPVAQFVDHFKPQVLDLTYDD